MENNPFDTVGGNENTGNTEDRTIMMNSLKDFHTGEVEQSEPSYDSEPENDDASGDNDNAEDSDEVTEEEYQEYLARKKERNKKIKAKNRHRRTMSHILAGVLLSIFIISVSAFLATYIVKSALDFTGIGKTYCQAEIHINEDSTTDEIAQDLANLGIINMPDVFKLYTNMFGKGDKFIKGTFTVDTTMSYSSLISTLQTVSTVNQTVTIQITEGMTIDEIAQMMEDNLVCRAEDFMEQWTEQLQSENLLEGYRAEKFIEYTDGAKPLTEMDTDFMLKTLDHIKVFEDGTLLVVFLDGTEIECKNEEE